METTGNTTVDTAATTAVEALTEILLDTTLTVLDDPMSLSAALKKMDAKSVILVQMSYDVVGVRPDNVLLLKASFELREAVATCYGEEELAELEAQDA